MDILTVGVFALFVAWGVWVMRYAITQYPIDRRLEQVTRLTRR